MTDDELIVLWSLSGMEFWAEFKRFDVEHFVKKRIRMDLDRLFLSYLLCPLYIRLFNEEYARYVSISDFGTDSQWEALCVIEDILTFNPNERWWKLLFARHWYAKNKERFTDG